MKIVFLVPLLKWQRIASGVRGKMSFMSSHSGLGSSFTLSHYLFTFLHASVHSGNGHGLVCFLEDGDVNQQTNNYTTG